MFKKIHYKVRGLPTPMAGLALGIASLGACLENALPLHGLGQVIAAGVSAFLLIMLTMRFVFHADTLAADLRHPVVGSVVPTFAMCWMVISATVGLFCPTTGLVIWSLAVLAHLAALVAFAYHRLRDPNIEHMVPSWFLPPIGIIVADVTFPGVPALLPLAQTFLWWGLVAYAILLPLMIYRLVFLSEVPNAAKPTLAILAAPASLALAGYLSIESQPDLVICAVLFGIALLMTLVIYFSFWHLFRLQFSPGYAAYTFPMAIGATALYKLADLVDTYPTAAQYAKEVRFLAHGELLVATVVIVAVSILYLKNFRMLFTK